MRLEGGHRRVVARVPISPCISLYLPISPYISQVALTALYTALGGLAAVIVTDVAQSVLARPRR